jgi:cyclophilin family peptidyl-prolyl cis-trans isomerase
MKSYFWRLAFLVFLGMSIIARAAPVAPSNCVATGIGDASGGASIYVSWNDNSTTETLWRIEYSANGSAFSVLGYPASSTTSGIGVTGIFLNGASSTTYSFKISAFDGSTFSTAAVSSSINTTVFTLEAAAVSGQTAINLSWPNIQNETGYNVICRPADAADGTAYSYLVWVGADVTSVQIASPTLEACKTYDFIVQPFVGSNSNIIGESNVATATVAGMTSKTGTSGTPGSVFLHTFTQVTGSAVSSRSLTGVPDGLSFNNSTGVLSGVYPAVGVYTLTYTVDFTGGSLTQKFYIRVRPSAVPPVVGTVIPAWSAAVGASRDTELAGKFTDPEAESAVRVSTSLGNMDFILFDSATPATVTNFMSYVNAGKYTDVAFHRSIAGFVIQGGGFKGAGVGSNFTSVITNPAVVNEPGIANEYGTVSMAKLEGDPNSATSQFFVSLGDNRSNLDYQNGGFTVFGRVAGSGMSVAEAISHLPNDTYNLFLDGGTTATAFSNFPLNVTSIPSPMDQAKVVKINSVTPIPILSYSVTGNSNPSVATASIIDGQLHLVGLIVGQTTITVTATDLDNLTTTQTVAVSINDTYTTWASRNTFPAGQSAMTQNPDGDAWNNLQEYAFLGNPATSDLTGQSVSLGATGATPNRYQTLTFPVRKSAQDLIYTVEANDSLSGAWTEIWKSSDGFLQTRVISAVDQTDRTVVTIQDNRSPIGIPTKRFLRVKVVQQ